MRALVGGTIAMMLALSDVAIAAAKLPDICIKTEFLERQPRRTADLETRYPKGQESMLGEGWVRLGATIDTSGRVVRMWLLDTIGSSIFAHATSGALAKAQYEPATQNGTPVEYHTEFQFRYLMSGRGPVAPHARASKTYDTAKALRDLGNHARSAEILLDLNRYTLTLYEYAITAYGLTMSYLGLNDRRRALRHARHAAAENGDFADRAQRRSALNLLADLAIKDNSFREGLCAYEVLRQKFPDFKPSAETEALVATARQSLTAATPLSTEVELVESMRADVQTMWEHEIVRSSFAIQRVQGKLNGYKLVCPAHAAEGPIPPAATMVNRSSGVCTLFVFGEPGARFVLEER